MYRRNADEDLRELERRLQAGDTTALPQIINIYARMGSFPFHLLLNYPEAFHYLPEQIQNQMREVVNAPPPAPPEPILFLCEECSIPDHDVCPMNDAECSCCQDTIAQLPNCPSCHASLIDEEQIFDCESIIDGEGDTCGEEICPNCAVQCPDCEMFICQECFTSLEDIVNRSSRHRCPTTAEGCSICGDDLFWQDRDETWCFISEEGAELLEECGESTDGEGVIVCANRCLDNCNLEIGDVSM